MRGAITFTYSSREHLFRLRSMCTTMEYINALKVCLVEVTCHSELICHLLSKATKAIFEKIGVQTSTVLYLGQRFLGHCTLGPQTFGQLFFKFS